MKKKTIKAYISSEFSDGLFDEDGVTLHKTQRDLFYWYGVSSLREWNDDVGYEIVPVEICILPPKKKTNPNK